MSIAPINLLLQNVEYKIEETPSGTWRRFLYPSGLEFAEYTSHRTWRDLPLAHFTKGKCPETGKRITARGVVAVGCFARGVVAVGVFSRGLLSLGIFTLGFVALGVVAVGLLFALGNFAIAFFACGQAAVGAILAVGQLAVGHIAIGQFAFGDYVLAQLGWGDHVWDTRTIDPVAHDFFLTLIGK